MLTIGITGGIGSGKSTVCKIFQILGIPVFNADVESRNILKNDELVKKEIKNLLGSLSYNSDNTPDRKFIASQVFADEKLLTQLNKILHPVVLNNFKIWRNSHSKELYIIKEAAILFESGSNKEMDFVIVVTSPLEMRIQRVMKRDTISRQLVEARISKQYPQEKLIELSDWEIKNNGYDLVISQVLALDQKIHTFQVANNG